MLKALFCIFPVFYFVRIHRLKQVEQTSSIKKKGKETWLINATVHLNASMNLAALGRRHHKFINIYNE
jgi:hypothetical protein